MGQLESKVGPLATSNKEMLEEKHETFSAMNVLFDPFSSIYVHELDEWGPIVILVTMDVEQNGNRGMSC